MVEYSKLLLWILECSVLREFLSRNMYQNNLESFSKYTYLRFQLKWCHVFSNISSSNFGIHLPCQATDMKDQYMSDSFQGDGPKGNKACKKLIDEVIKLLLLRLKEL